MRIEPDPRARARARVGDELRAGFRYVTDFLPVRTLLLLLALVSIMGMPYTVLMPAMATSVLHGGANTLGFLMGATGIGALAAALYLASRHSVIGLGRAIAGAVIVFGAGLIAFGTSRHLLASLLILPFVGGAFMLALAGTNTIVQTIVEEHLRGRVMAFYAMAILGTAPIGSLLAGLLASRIGVPATIQLGGAACVAGGIAFTFRLPRLRELVRPIYVQQGIISVPAVDAGT